MELLASTYDNAHAQLIRIYGKYYGNDWVYKGNDGLLYVGRNPSNQYRRFGQCASIVYNLKHRGTFY